MRLSLPASLLLSTLIAPIAHAKVVYRSGNWALDDLSQDTVPQNLCAMVQEAKIGRTTWRLEITHPKLALGVTEILLKQTGTGAKAWSLTTQTGETLVFANAGKLGTSTTDVLWHIPQKTSALIAHWEGRKDIRVSAADGTRSSFQLFDSGFALVKQQMVQRCLGTIPLVDSAFETAFLRRTTAINPNLVSETAVAQLRALVPQAHEVFLKLGANSQELTQLRAQFAGPLQEAATLTATIARLEQNEIPTLERAQTANEALQVSATADLQRLTNLIPQQERALTSATQVRDRAYQAIEPYLNEHEALTDAVSSAESQISTGESRIAEIDRATSSANSEIRQLNSELSSLVVALRQNESSLRTAESEARRAESEFRAYRPDAELRQILQRDSSYQSAQRDLSRIEREQSRSHDDWKRAVADRESKERVLNSCRAAGPEADCRSQHDAWKVAVAQADRLESEYRRFDGQLASLRSTIDRAESAAAREVERERNQLGDRMTQTQRRADEFQRAVSEGQRREREITSYELPRLNDRVHALERERPLVVDQVSRGRSDLSRANSALASFEQRVGWRAKLAAYNAADEAMDARQSELNTSVRSKQTAERNIQTAQTQRPLLAQQLIEKRQLLASSKARLVEVRRSLEAFESERARLEAVGSELTAQLAGLATEFEGQLPQ